MPVPEAFKVLLEAFLSVRDRGGLEIGVNDLLLALDSGCSFVNPAPPGSDREFAAVPHLEIPLSQATTRALAAIDLEAAPRNDLRTALLAERAKGVQS